MTGTNSPKIYSAAVIGCGRIGSLLERDKLRSHPCTHAGIYNTHARTELVAGCDRRAIRRAQFSTDWGIPASRVFSDYRDLLREIQPEIVSVGTYTDSHAEITIAAARSGVKIVLCEKPMAIDLAQARRMIDVCRSEGVTLAIHHERRWCRVWRLVKKMIDDGELGEIRTVIGNVLTQEPHPDWHSRLEISGGGPTLHDGTHLFDSLRYFCGEMSSIQGGTERMPEGKIEHTGWAVMRFENGAMAFVECGGRRKYFNFEMDIQGSKGRMIIGNAVFRYFSIGPSPRYEGFTEFAERTPPPFLDDTDYYPYIIEELIEARETGRDSISSGEDGFAALEAVLSVYADKFVW